MKPVRDVSPVRVRDLLPGARVVVRAPEGGTYADVVRCVTRTHLTLAPYARNRTVVCVVLTERSWCRVSDVIEVAGGAS